MNHLQALLILAPALGLSLAPLAPQSQSPGLIRILPRPAESAQFDAESWRARLTASDLDRREQDFALLTALVRRDAGARAEVERWAREGDSELAWTARLILRESDPLARSRGGGGLTPWLQLPELDLDALRDWRGGPEIWLHELQPLWEQDLLLPPGGATAPSGGATSQAQKFELRSGPDGVKVTVEDQKDGNVEKKEYEAATLDELLDQHPELRERLGAQGLGGRGPRGFLDLRLGQAPAAAPRTDVLGVTVRPLPKDEARSLGLEEGIGLVVERIEPRSIAAALGIQRGHVLTRMNDRDLRQASDITDELCARAVDGEVRVELIDRWGQRRTRTWKPDDRPAAAPPASRPTELRKI